MAGGKYKLGAPYQIEGVWYVPAEEPDYDEVGVASWYGDEFDGKATANGEVFDNDAASAAHATLPMPSIVEVTNLDNGRTIRVRLNDRGPYKSGRLIDLSRGAAQELGYMDKGTAKVRVRYVGPAKLDATLEPLYVAANTRRLDARAPVRQGPIAETPPHSAPGRTVLRRTRRPAGAPPRRKGWGRGLRRPGRGLLRSRPGRDRRPQPRPRPAPSPSARSRWPAASSTASSSATGATKARPRPGRAQVASLGYADARVIVLDNPA